MRFKKNGLKALLGLCMQAEQKSDNGELLWQTGRNYNKLYMTDILQELINEGNRLKAVHIKRGWYEIDNKDDLQLAESLILSGITKRVRE